MLFVSDKGFDNGAIDDYQKYVDELLAKGLTSDPLAVQILTNIDNLINIIKDYRLPSRKPKNREYFLAEPLYLSIPDDVKIPAKYLQFINTIDVTNYLRSGIADDYLKNRGGVKFHYYTYLSEINLSATLTKDNFELIYGNHMLIKTKWFFLQYLVHELIGKPTYDIDYNRLYNIPRAKAIEIGYDLLQGASIKHKFDLRYVKYMNSMDIIKCCIDEQYLLKHNIIEKSIKALKYKKTMILNKVKKEFNGSGSIWNFICSSDTLYIDELRFIADINGIKNTGMLSKQDLCSELEKLSTLNKNKVLVSCQNESDISGDDIKDIPAEYFFSYEENGKHYCTDIRSAYANIKAGNNKNPYTNVEISEEIRNQIIEVYEATIKPEQESKPTFSQLLANFSSKIPYLNSVELYKNATKEQLKIFYDRVQEYPTYQGLEVDKLFEDTLEDDKYIIINSILLDTNFDDFKYQLRQDYNRIFSGIANPVRLTITEMIKKISPDLNEQHYINATRYEVYEFIKKVDETGIMTEELAGEYDDDSVSYEEFKQMALEYVYNLIFSNNEIDEDYKNKVIVTYNREFVQ